MNTKVLIIMAMADEAQPVIEALKLSKEDKPDSSLPIESYASADKKIRVVINGKDPHYQVDCIGTQAAAIAAVLAIRTYDPDLIISAGTAGGFRAKGASIGDVYLSRRIAFHDRRIALPGFDKYGQCIIETPLGIELAEKLKFKTGNISSGNSLDMPEQDKQTITAMNGEIKEMEAASIAWVARLYHKKMIAVKSITDLMDAGKPTEEEFLENLKMASEKLKEGLLKVLKIL